MNTENLWEAIASKDLQTLTNLLNDRFPISGGNKPMKRLEITVNVPREAIPVKLIVQQCRSCGLLCAIDKQALTTPPCPYCGEELILFDATPDPAFTGYGYGNNQKEKD